MADPLSFVDQLEPVPRTPDIAKIMGSNLAGLLGVDMTAHV